MNLRKLAFLFVVLVMNWNSNFIFAQYPQIVNPVSAPVMYCSSPVLIAGEITIQNIKIAKSDDGLKISIDNYKEGEDSLVWKAVHDFSYEWKEEYGFLEIKGVGDSKEYQQAIRDVYYKNTSDNPNMEPRSFSITLLDANYLPYTKHFYEYVKQNGVSWEEARSLAANMEYYGLKGYLATITSRVENDFIWTKVAGIGWFGASDSRAEGDWRWVTGPEKGTLFWSGGVNGSQVNGEYSNWGSSEPNNLGGGENYAHLGHPNLSQKSWNDQRNKESNPNSIYGAKGYIVEYGGMEDTDSKLSATALLEWSGLQELDFSKVDTLICGSMTQELELSFIDDRLVPIELRSLQSEASVTDETTLSPTINVNRYGIYTFEVKVGGLDECSSFDTITIGFHNDPLADFLLDEEKCYGYNVDLEFSGTTVEPANYAWLANNIVFASGDDLTEITIPLGYGEKNRTVGIRVNEQGCIDSLSMPVKSAPEMNFWVEENSKGCSPLNVKFGNSDVDSILSYKWEFGDGNSSDIEKPLHTYTNRGEKESSFDVLLTVLSENGCKNTGVLSDTIVVFPQPVAAFSTDPSVAIISNPLVHFKNESENSSLFEWDFKDNSAYSLEQDPQYYFSDIGFYGVKLLAQNEFACIDTITQQVKVAFDMVFPPTAFSPNALLEKDREFRIYSKGIGIEGYNLQVFNRWGEVIFESLSQELGWNGKMQNDNFAPAGVYPWVIQYLDFLGDQHKQQGTVTLLF